jgi:hypothetical protein
MVTLFDLLQLLGLALGMVLGALAGGRSYGWPGLLLGGLGGGVAGMVVSRVPHFIASGIIYWHIHRQPTAALRRHLRGPVWSAYHLYLAELRGRGEDLRPELDVVVSLLVAVEYEKRFHGWHILRGLYPEQAARLPDYDPADAPERCRAKVARSGLPRPDGGL